jgi:hypothetical protein
MLAWETIERSLLVGGVGLDFSLRATLDKVGPDAR